MTDLPLPTVLGVSRCLVEVRLAKVLMKEMPAASDIGVNIGAERTRRSSLRHRVRRLGHLCRQLRVREVVRKSVAA